LGPLDGGRFIIGELGAHDTRHSVWKFESQASGLTQFSDAASAAALFWTQIDVVDLKLIAQPGDLKSQYVSILAVISRSARPLSGSLPAKISDFIAK
jgi:hypothetical protein